MQIEAWEKPTTCQQCGAKLSPAELKLGRLCNKCVKKNKGRVWGKDSDDDYHEETRMTKRLSFSEYIKEVKLPEATTALTDDGKPIVQTVHPPGMDDWIKSNKKKFIKQYGADRGESILLSTAWDMHNRKQSDDASKMDESANPTTQVFRLKILDALQS